MLPARNWAISDYQIVRSVPENTTVENAKFGYPADAPHSARPTRVDYRISGPRATATSQAKLIRYEPWEVDESAFDPAAHVRNDWNCCANDVASGFHHAGSLTGWTGRRAVGNSGFDALSQYGGKGTAQKRPIRP